MKTRIHVNQHAIRRNNKVKEGNPLEPVLTCKTYKDNTYCKRVAIKDSLGNTVAEVVYNPDKPLPCGAKVWIETENEIEIEE